MKAQEAQKLTNDSLQSIELDFVFKKIKEKSMQGQYCLIIDAKKLSRYSIDELLNLGYRVVSEKFFGQISNYYIYWN